MAVGLIRIAVLVALLPLFAGVTGCGVAVDTGQGDPGLGGAPGGDPLAGGGGIPGIPGDPTAPGAPGGIGDPAAGGDPGATPLPPSIGGTGASGGNPPITVLEPPAAVAARAGQVASQFGLRGIRGTQVSPLALDKLARAYAKFPRDALRDLEVVFEKIEDSAVRGLDFDGLWTPLDAQGRNPEDDPDLPRDARVVGARIWYVLPADQLGDALLTHEVGHHVSIYADPAWGQDFVAAAGWRKRNDPDFTDPCVKFDRTEFAPDAVDPSSYVTDYARTDAYEDIAEMISFHVSGPAEFSQGAPIRPGFRMPAACQSRLRSKLGAARSI